MSANELIQRRAAMMQSRSGSIDWENIAKGMIDKTVAFSIPSTVEVDPPTYGFYERPLLSGTIAIKTGLTEVAHDTFYGCTSLTEVILPSTITKINNNAFQRCTSLVTINLPDGITLIGNNAFSNCPSLQLTTMPSSLTQINSYALQKCISLTTLTFKSNLTTIQGSCIVGCSSLTELIFESVSPPSYGANAISNNTNLSAIYVPDASVSAYQAASGWSTHASLIKPISQRP